MFCRLTLRMLRRRARHVAPQRGPLRPAHPARLAHPRAGSTLVVVMALLGLLAFLGFVFFTFAAQERSNAEYFCSSAKHLTDPGYSQDFYFDYALKQLIIGPDPQLVNSALWGARHSMVPNAVGLQNTSLGMVSDYKPFNGRGIQLSQNSATGDPQVDMDLDGTQDNPSLMFLNDSPVAWGGNARTDFSTFKTNVDPYFNFDVDYTYPDINNLFLAYKGFALDPNGQQYSVIIPSFHRPQYLRKNHIPVSDWYNNTTQNMVVGNAFTGTGRHVLRPHPSHVFAGNNNGDNRFVTTAAEVTALQGQGLAITQPFPFQTGSGNQGVWSLSTSPSGPLPTIEYDVDNDNDGKPDSVYLDLDFPLQTRADGKTMIPLAAFLVLDADGLLNLNGHGNLAGNVGLQNNPFGNGGLLSRSDQGLSRSEVNLQWALNANPTAGSADFPGNASALNTALQQHYFFFGHNPNSNSELSNMEWFFLNVGRAQFSSMSAYGNIYPGRWFGPNEKNYFTTAIAAKIAGNPNALAFFPRPGVINNDDNYNRYEGESYPTNQPNAQSLAFGQPLDYTGGGRRTLLSTQGKQLNLQQFGPNYFQTYVGYQTLADNAQTMAVQSATALGGGLMVDANNNPTINAPTDQLLDEPAETIVDLGRKDDLNDDIFGVDEMAYLHLSTADAQNNSPQSRAATLAPFNLQTYNNTSQQGNTRGSQICERLTTLSFDRRQFGFPHYHSNTGTGYRNWEMTAAGGGAPAQFPPIFANSTGYDPFRTELRDLLRVHPLNTNGTYQQPLNINKVLWTAPGQAKYSYRALTLHPSDPQGTVANIGPNTSQNLAQYPPQSQGDQEWWARYDRQVLARDIYVMLYTLGGGNDSDVTTTPGGGYTPTEKKDMAQFAVNLVDALDPDDNMTQFEYDVDLSNGWGLDDNPYLTGAFSQDSQGGDRATVWGVETQQLTFSEVLAIQAQKSTGTNYATTSWDDASRDHYYMFVELRNTSAFDVPLNNVVAGGGNNSIYSAWKLQYFSDSTLMTAISPVPTVPVVPPMPTQELTFAYAPTGGGNANTVPATGTFVIGTTEGDDKDPNMVVRPSDFRVDYNVDGTFDRVAPVNNLGSDPLPTATSTGISSYCNLDLVWNSHQQRFKTTAGTVGSFFNHLNAPPAGSTAALRLLRRANPNMTGLNTTDNPWILVDQTTFQPQPFGASSTAASLQSSLASVKSNERRTPLNRNIEQPSNAAAPRINTIGSNNSVQPTPPTAPKSPIWQPVQNRDFASVVELFSIPLYSPERVTSNLTAVNQLGSPIAGDQKFLYPSGTLIGGGTTDNRWYRLLNFIEVPAREHTHPQFGNALTLPRVPGRINLNAIRHQEVLAGLLDDPDIFSINFNPPYYLTVNDTSDLDGGGVNRRDFWRTFLQSRDAQDTVTGLYLPGTVSTRPFRSLAMMATRPVNGAPAVKNYVLEDTVLRSVPYDAQPSTLAPTPTARRLFEVGTPNDHNNLNVDPTVRHRLLQKVVNNSTTRSNVFYVYLTIDFFEAVKIPSSSTVKIGGKLAGSPRYRGFFVIDRSNLEQAYDTATNTFNYRTTIQYRRTLN